MYVIQQEVAEAYKVGKTIPASSPPAPAPGTSTAGSLPGSGATPSGPAPSGSILSRLTWSGEIPSQKWMNFYTKVLSKFAAGMGLKLTLKVEVSSDAGIPIQKVEETKVALRELGLSDEMQTSEVRNERI